VEAGPVSSVAGVFQQRGGFLFDFASCGTGRHVQVGLGSARLGHVVRSVAFQHGSVVLDTESVERFQSMSAVARLPVAGVLPRDTMLTALLAAFGYLLQDACVAECLDGIYTPTDPGCARSNSQSLFDANHGLRSIGLFPAGSRPGQEGRNLVRPRRH
jgi:hypothetical protein